MSFPRFSKDPRTEQSLRHSVRDGVAYSVMAGAGEHYLSAYALFLKATTAQISWLAAFPSLIGSFAQLFSAWLASRLGRRKAIMLFGVVLQTAMWLPIIWLPYFFPAHAVTILIVCAALYYAGNHLAAPVWNSLMGDLVPERRRGRFFARRTRLMSMTNFLALVGAGLLLYGFEIAERVHFGFMLIFTVAALARLYSATQIARMHDPERAPATVDWPALSGLWQRLCGSDCGRFSLFFAAMQFAVAIASPFFAVYMLRDLGFSYLEYMSSTALAVLAQVGSLRMWGRLGDIFGNRVILSVTGSVIPIFPLLWLVSPHFAYVAALQMCGGIFWAGFSLSATNYLYDSVSPGRRAAYSAIHNVFASLAIFAGALLGGFLSLVVPENFILFGKSWHWTSSLWGVLVVSSLARGAVALSLAPVLREVRDVRQLTAAGLILRVARFNALAELFFDVLATTRRRLRAAGQ
ncbi:MAG: MFS transporter [Sulfuricaulis sp.]